MAGWMLHTHISSFWLQFLYTLISHSYNAEWYCCHHPPLTHLIFSFRNCLSRHLSLECFSNIQEHCISIVFFIMCARDDKRTWWLMHISDRGTRYLEWGALFNCVQHETVHCLKCFFFNPVCVQSKCILYPCNVGAHRLIKVLLTNVLCLLEGVTLSVTKVVVFVMRLLEFLLFSRGFARKLLC